MRLLMKLAVLGSLFMSNANATPIYRLDIVLGGTFNEADKYQPKSSIDDFFLPGDSRWVKTTLFLSRGEGHVDYSDYYPSGLGQETDDWLNSAYFSEHDLVDSEGRSIVTGAAAPDLRFVSDVGYPQHGVLVDHASFYAIGMDLMVWDTIAPDLVYLAEPNLWWSDSLANVPFNVTFAMDPSGHLEFDPNGFENSYFRGTRSHAFLSLYNPGGGEPVLFAGLSGERVTHAPLPAPLAMITAGFALLVATRLRRRTAAA